MKSGPVLRGNGLKGRIEPARHARSLPAADAWDAERRTGQPTWSQYRPRCSQSTRVLALTGQPAQREASSKCETCRISKTSYQ